MEFSENLTEAFSGCIRYMYDKHYRNKDFGNIMDKFISFVSKLPWYSEIQQMIMDIAIDSNDHTTLFKLIEKKCIIPPDAIDDMIQMCSIYCTNEEELNEEFITILKICVRANIKMTDSTIDTIKSFKDYDINIYNKILSLGIQIDN